MIMRFLADENIASSVITALQKEGYEVFDVKVSALRGKSDEKLITYALKKHLVIITHDKDFLHQNRVPVILLRFQNLKPQETIEHLLAFLNSNSGKLGSGITAVLSEHTVEFHYPLNL